MKKYYPLLIVIGLTLPVVGCVSNGRSSTQLASNFIQKQKVVATTKELYPAKAPQSVAIYSDENKPLNPYRIIGIASVAKSNILGMQRANATINEMMKNLAASIGGDGLINVSQENDEVEAKVIAFQKILI